VGVAMLRIMFDKPEQFGDGFWIGWAISVPSLAVISLLSVAPLMWLILAGRSWSIAALAIAGYWLGIAAIISSIFLYLNPNNEGKSIALALSLVSLTGLVTVSVPLWLARGSGYCLRMGK